MSTTPRLSDRLRDAAIQRENLGPYVRALLFEAADAIDGPEPVREVVKEMEIS